MTVNQEVKGTLAKLLATENLNVEHRNVSTAYFDIGNRVLCLPIWKDVSSTVYDLLVGHEVGHALYTPLDYAEVSVDIPQDILNVLEDVRVEKLMKRRYPGLARSFYHGYNELNEKDFFELKDKDLSKMAFIDRINVHYKCGVVGNRTIVPFDREETVFVNRVAETETFEDVVDLCFELVDYLQSKKTEEEEISSTPQSSSAQQDDGEQTEQIGPSSSSKSDQGSDFGGDTETTQDGGSGAQLGGNQEPVDEFVSETARALADNQQSLVDHKSKDYVYVNIPKFDLNQTIVPFKNILTDFTVHINSITELKPKSVECAIQKYRKYKKDSIKTVNYLVKEFECKKAADSYHRASVANTGVLDTQKLHTYKWNEDVFRKVTTIPDGKNHGLVFYLDWSGSMASTMLSTLKQLYDLVWFCKKVNIPFRVYAFSDCNHNNVFFPGQPTENNLGDLHVDTSFRLLELLSSKMNAQSLDKMMECLFFNCDQLRNGGDYDYRYSLAGTPLSETLCTVPQITDKFRSEEKVQKVNVICLSDGESAWPNFNKHIDSMNAMYNQPIQNGNRTFVMKDPKTRYQKTLNLERGNITALFADFISNIVDCNLLGFRLGTKTDLRAQAEYAGITNFDALEKQWVKEKSACIPNCGFKELYMMTLPKNTFRYWDPVEDDNEEIEVKENATTGQLSNAFKKHMNGKMVNKVILSKFIRQIA